MKIFCLKAGDRQPQIQGHTGERKGECLVCDSQYTVAPHPSLSLIPHFIVCRISSSSSWAWKDMDSDVKGRQS